MIHNVVLVSGVLQSGSVIHIYIYIYILIFIDFKKILVIIYHPHKAKTVKTVFGSDDGLSLN